jgi:hypothetical protein
MICRLLAEFKDAPGESVRRAERGSMSHRGIAVGHCMGPTLSGREALCIRAAGR